MPPAVEQPLRVALVTTELRPGGAERALARLAVGLDREQFSPQVYSLAPPPPAEQSQLVEQLQAAQVPVHFVGVGGRWQFFTAVRRLRKELREQSPHVIQAFLFHANIIAALAARELDVPVLAGLRVAQPEMLRRFVQRRLSGRFAGFVCVSDDVARQAVGQGGLPQEKVHVIPNSVEILEDNLDLPLGEGEGEGGIDAKSGPCAPAIPKTILFIGRLEPQKGPDILLAAAEHFLPQLPQHQLLILGEGPLRRSLESQASQLSCGDRVRFAGWVANVRPLLAAADLVVIPSRWEGMSNVLLEAMAAGKAVVASDVEGVRQALGEAADRQVVPHLNAKTLSDRITQLASAPDVRQDLGEQNRQRAIAHFSPQAMIGAYGRLWRQTAWHG